MNIEHVLEQMTLEEKTALCSGADFWHTRKIETYGIEERRMSDGPHGLRKQEESADMLGINESVPATSFPTAVTTACSWDEALLKRMGEAIAREALSQGVQIVLGPGANIKRNPLCGRNFEYFSEDPYLSGKLAAAQISGIEKTGAAASLKHFALNNQEFKRFSSDSLVDERTMREIYLSGFETAVKEGRPSTVMCAYNKINGVYCSDNTWLLTDLLRKEWGFDGVVVTDWGAMNDRVKAFEAGCDLMMPGGSDYMEQDVYEAVKDGRLSEKSVTASARRILELVAKTETNGEETADYEEHFQLAKQIAEESAVLLKNEDRILPLKSTADVIFAGHMAKELRYQGAGSSHINPWKLVSVADACPEIPFYEGCLPDGSTTEQLLKEAEEGAKNAGQVVIFAGLTAAYESEGFDRKNMKMPPGHIEMIERIAAVNPNVIVVLMCGGAVELPFIDRIKALLYLGLPGEAGGEAVRDLLFGKADPRGRLAETWPVCYEDCVCSNYYGTKDAQYREGIYVGYRYYESADVKVRFPFGYGLSYTEFSYSQFHTVGNRVSCVVENTGAFAGSEVVQLYVEPLNSAVHRPVRELKGFQKIRLLPGEKRKITFLLNDRSFAVWDRGWKVPGGIYRLCLGKSVHEICLSGEIYRQGEMLVDSKDLPQWYRTLDGTPQKEDLEMLLHRKITERALKKGAYTKENTVLEMKETSFIMRMIYRGAEFVLAKKYGGKDDSNPEFKMMMIMSMDCSLRGMCVNSGISWKYLEGLLLMANGHFFRGLKRMLKK